MEVCRAGNYMDVKVPEAYQTVIKSLRLPAWTKTMGVDENTGDGKKVSAAPDTIPKTSEYQHGLLRIALQVCAEFQTFPSSRDALLGDMKSRYGLNFDMLKEALAHEGETGFVNVGTDGTETA